MNFIFVVGWLDGYLEDGRINEIMEGYLHELLGKLSFLLGIQKKVQVDL